MSSHQHTFTCRGHEYELRASSGFDGVTITVFEDGVEISTERVPSIFMVDGVESIDPIELVENSIRQRSGKIARRLA